MVAFAYPAEFQVTDGEVIVRFRDVPGALTGADSLDEARALAADALEEAVLAMLANDEAVPEPSAVQAGEELVALNPVTAGRVLFDQRRRALGLSKVAAADQVGKDEKVVRRILDGRGRVSADTVFDALRELGERPYLSA